MPVLWNAINLLTHGGGEEPEEEIGSTAFWSKIVISAALVILGGIFAGLTLGLMGLDDMHLRVLAQASDNPKEKANARKVLKLMNRGRHWILVVLLLSNVVINESLPIFLDSAIGGGVAAVVIATTMIVIFGEIIPQSLCNKYGLSIGATAAPFVLALMYIFAPIAWPIAKLLDYLLGKDEGHTYKKAELKTFLQFHRQGEEPLRDEEISILNGVLSLNEKTVQSIMTPFKDVVTIAADQVLTHQTVDVLLSSGYSRFPVHAPGKPTAFVGLLLVKKLLRYDPDEQKKVSQLPLSILPEAHPSISCFQALDYFQSGRSHLLLVTKSPGVYSPNAPLGVVTLEDIIEEIIGEEIVDETDRYESNTSKAEASRQSTAGIMKGIFEHAWRRGTMETIKQSIPEEDPTVAAPVLTDSPPSETQPLLPGARKPNDQYGATKPRAR